jgi:hypothetical protein
MEWFIESIDCRRVILGQFIDGDGRDCQEGQDEIYIISMKRKGRAVTTIVTTTIMMATTARIRMGYFSMVICRKTRTRTMIIIATTTTTITTTTTMGIITIMAMEQVRMD